MNTVKGYARIVRINGKVGPGSGVEALKWIEWCGRVSHRSEEAQTEDSWDRFIRAVVLGHGDWSIVEHATATVDMLVDRGITHEVVRHRLFSFTQESTRFVNYEKKMPAVFVEPPGLTDDARRAPNGEAVEMSTRQMWRHAVDTVETMYRMLVQSGLAPQIARSVFPNALASRIIITGNLRNWRHFLIMRTTREAHPQMREVAIPLLEEFKSSIPILFEDIEPMSKQSEAIKTAR